jgi:hypothetical protein
MNFIFQNPASTCVLSRRESVRIRNTYLSEYYINWLLRWKPIIWIRIRIILPRPDLQQFLRICTIQYDTVPIYRNDKALVDAWSMSTCVNLSKIYLYMGENIWRNKFEKLMTYRWEKMIKNILWMSKYRRIIARLKKKCRTRIGTECLDLQKTQAGTIGT